MAEIFWRCRFFPRCAIHLGRDVPTDFSPENVTEMKQMYRTGSRLVDIAEEFETTVSSVSRQVKHRRVKGES